MWLHGYILQIFIFILKPDVPLWPHLPYCGSSDPNYSSNDVAQIRYDPQVCKQIIKKQFIATAAD